MGLPVGEVNFKKKWGNCEFYPKKKRKFDSLFVCGATRENTIFKAHSMKFHLTQKQTNYILYIIIITMIRRCLDIRIFIRTWRTWIWSKTRNWIVNTNLVNVDTSKET